MNNRRVVAAPTAGAAAAIKVRGDPRERVSSSDCEATQGHCSSVNNQLAVASHSAVSLHTIRLLWPPLFLFFLPAISPTHAFAPPQVEPTFC